MGRAIRCSLTLFEIEREARRFVVATSQSGAPISQYQTQAMPSTHVVLDPPAAERVVVEASSGTAAGTCDITLSAATGNDGFESRPLVFTLDASCHVAEETSQPPVGAPSTSDPDDSDAGMGGAAGSGSGSNAGSADGGMNSSTQLPEAQSSGGCGCQTTPRGRSGLL